MCEECDSGISESELMDRLKEALDQRDAYRLGLNDCLTTPPKCGDMLMAGNGNTVRHGTKK